jgi:hypothetical protein
MACKCQNERSKGLEGKAVGTNRTTQVSSQSPQHPLDRLKALQQTLGNQGVFGRMEAGIRINDVNTSMLPRMCLGI